MLNSQAEQFDFNLLEDDKPKYLPHYKRGYHGYKLIGGDDHDSVPHGKPLLGGDDHDNVPHESNKQLFGHGIHDYVVHAMTGTGKPHGPKFAKDVEYAPVDENDAFMMRKLPPMEESLKKLKEMQSQKNFHSFMNMHNKARVYFYFFC